MSLAVVVTMLVLCCSLTANGKGGISKMKPVSKKLTNQIDEILPDGKFIEDSSGGKIIKTVIIILAFGILKSNSVATPMQG